MSFAEEMKKAGNFTRTENGAVALSTTGDACLDLFSTIGSLREADENRIHTLFSEAYQTVHPSSQSPESPSRCRSSWDLL